MMWWNLAGGSWSLRLISQYSCHPAMWSGLRSHPSHPCMVSVTGWTQSWKMLIKSSQRQHPVAPPARPVFRPSSVCLGPCFKFHSLLQRCGKYFAMLPLTFFFLQFFLSVKCLVKEIWPGSSSKYCSNLRYQTNRPFTNINIIKNKGPHFFHTKKGISRQLPFYPF